MCTPIFKVIDDSYFICPYLYQAPGVLSFNTCGICMLAFFLCRRENLFKS